MPPMRVGGTPPAPSSAVVDRATKTAPQGRAGQTGRGVPVRGLNPAPPRGMRATLVSGLRYLRAQISPPRLQVPKDRTQTQGAVARTFNSLLTASVSRRAFARQLAPLALQVPDIPADDFNEIATGKGAVGTLESRQAEALSSLDTASLRRMEQYLFSPHMDATLVALADRGQESILQGSVLAGVANREDVAALQPDCDGEAALQMQTAVAKLRTALRSELHSRNESPAPQVGYAPTPSEAKAAAQEYLDAIHSMSITSGSLPVSEESIKQAEQELGTLESSESILTAEEVAEPLKLSETETSGLRDNFFLDMMRCQVVLIDQDGQVEPFADTTLNELRGAGKQANDPQVAKHAEQRLTDFVGGDKKLAFRIAQVAHQGSSLWVASPSRVGIEGSGPTLDQMTHAYPLRDDEDFSRNRLGELKRNRHFIITDENRHEDTDKGSAFGSTGWRDGMSIAIRKNKDNTCNVVVHYRARPKFVSSLAAVNHPLDGERSLMENMLNFKVVADAPIKIESGRSSWRIMPPSRTQIEKTEIQEAKDLAEAKAKAEAEAHARAEAEGQAQ